MPLSYKCLIADDNLLDCDVLEMYISKIDSLQIESVCSDGLLAAAYLQKNKIDIVLTDIDMPNLSGMELLQSLKKPPVFIFISSHAEHAAESYSLDVIDFIVKPVSLERLKRAVNKAIEYIELKKNLDSKTDGYSTNAVLESIELSENKNLENYFYIKADHDYIKIDHEEVIYIESMGNFSKLHTVQNKKHLALVSLKNVETYFSAQKFMRVHKQFIINLNHIESVSMNGFVLLIGGNSIPLGNNYKIDLMKMVNENTLWR